MSLILKACLSSTEETFMIKSPLLSLGLVIPLNKQYIKLVETPTMSLKGFCISKNNKHDRTGRFCFVNKISL